MLVVIQYLRVGGLNKRSNIITMHRTAHNIPNTGSWNALYYIYVKARMDTEEGGGGGKGGCPPLSSPPPPTPDILVIHS